MLTNWLVTLRLTPKTSIGIPTVKGNTIRVSIKRRKCSDWLSLELSTLRSSMVSLQMFSSKLRKVRSLYWEISSAFERHACFKWRCYKNAERIPQRLCDLMNFILESLKNLRQNLVLYLLICSNNLLIRVKSPRNGLWLTAVHFIRKKIDRALPSNYRPVSLICVPRKMLEHIVCTNIMAHLD